MGASQDGCRPPRMPPSWEAVGLLGWGASQEAGHPSQDADLLECRPPSWEARGLLRGVRHPTRGGVALRRVAVTQALRDANYVEQGLRLDRCSAVFHDLHLVGATDADGDLEESSARAHLRAKESPTCSAAHLAPNDEILPPRERAPRAKQHMLARTEPRAIVALGSLFVRCGCMHEFYRGEG